MYKEVSQYTDTNSPQPYFVAHYGRRIPFVEPYDPEVGWVVREWPAELGQQPTAQQVLDWVPPAPEEPAPLTAFEKAVQDNKVILANREEQAKGDITELKSRVAVTLVATGARMADDTLITADNVNAEGSRFVVWHAALISAYKDAGGNPEAGQALYNSIASAPSLAAFPWLTEPVLAIFAATLLVESPAP